MSSPPTIRPLVQDDLKMVKYQIGLSEMGPLAVANNNGSLVRTRRSRKVAQAAF
jgi:hypothetical protein